MAKHKCVGRAGSQGPTLWLGHYLIPGVFITHGDVGVGTIVGSAVFNILCIIGVCGLFAGQVSRFFFLCLPNQYPVGWG